MKKLLSIVGHPLARWIFLAFSLVLLVWNGYHLYADALWSYHPLSWELGAYGVLLFFYWKKLTASTSAIYRWGLSTLSGLLLSVAFPMSPAWMVMFIAFVPLLILAENKELPFWRLIGHCFHAFLIWNIITTFWVLNTSFAPGIVANSLNAFLMTMPWMLFYFVRRRFPIERSLVVLAAAWISFEYLHLQWEISWPWLNIGNVFAAYPDVVQWYEYTGCFGGALWIWIVNILVFLGWKGYLTKPQSRIWTAVIVVLPIVVSMLIGYTVEEEGEQIQVGIIQPNYEPHYEKFDVSPIIQLQRMLGLAEEVLEDSTDYLLLPETVFSRVILNRVNNNPAIKKWNDLTMTYPDLNVVIGVSSQRVYEKDSLLNRATRRYIREGGRDTTYWDVQNAALWLTSGEVQEDYFKSKLVPGAEIFPYHEYLFFLKPIIDALEGSKEGHVVQDSVEIFGKIGKEIAPVICYESIYGDYVNQYIRKGAKAIFIMTNDGWWDDTPGHRQHLSMARLRAIETRRSIARAANTGISCFIDQKGRIHQPTLYGETISISGKVTLNERLTFYTRYGDYIAKMAVLLTLITLVLIGIRGLKPDADRDGQGS